MGRGKNKVVLVSGIVYKILWDRMTISREEFHDCVDKNTKAIVDYPGYEF